MAQVTLPPFLRSISGRLGNICFRTYASGKTGFYLLSSPNHATPISKEEMRTRELFAERVQRVNNIMKDDPSITRKQAWIIVKQIPS